MPPFVPPPAREAPYRALPIVAFSPWVKFLACFAAALPFFGASLLAPILSGVAFLINYSIVLHSSDAQHRLTVIAVGGFLVPIGLGCLAAFYKLLRIQIDEWTTHPPTT
jgi:hypothetical protein